ncbi:ankyrin repeat domain-containing protein [Sulfuricella sp.]|uniref:ankyrin repeat domain-containing protein n=1 Tax=Sulfuricella sp. TaxID=2099377 RepID=UPI002C36A2C2|nr:ankyrin repeat domain-containing protein [Sulfuricella sp.]HUX62708.1 ankyrin repeat domain-containing protein [Sulfuricella sp.]
MNKSHKIIGVAIFLLSVIGNSHAAGTIFEAARSGTVQEVEKMLAANKSLVNARTELGSTPLHIAATRSNPEIAKLLLAKGADINAKDNNGTTPLHIAAFTGKKELVEFFLSKGADAYAMDFKNETPRDKAHHSLSSEIEGVLAVWMLKNPQPAKKK